MVHIQIKTTAITLPEDIHM